MSKADDHGRYIKTPLSSYISSGSSFPTPSLLTIAGKCVIKDKTVVGSAGGPVRIGWHVWIEEESRIEGCVKRGSAPQRNSPAGDDATTAATTSSKSNKNDGSDDLDESAALAAAHYHTLSIGRNTFIGKGCVVKAREIGSSCYIGEGTMVGSRALVGDCVNVLENSVIPDDACYPPYTVVSGSPAAVVGDVEDWWGDEMEFKAEERWQRFKDSLSLGQTQGGETTTAQG